MARKEFQHGHRFLRYGTVREFPVRSYDTDNLPMMIDKRHNNEDPRTYGRDLAVRGRDAIFFGDWPRTIEENGAALTESQG